jgi:sensor histidine kinase YesM
MKFKLLVIDRQFLKRWFLFSLAAGLAIPLFYFPEGYTSVEGLKKVWDDVIYSFGISLGISGSVGLVEVNLNHYVPWIKAPVKRFFLEFLGVTVLGFSAVFVVSFLFFWSFGLFTLSDIPWSKILEQTRVPMYIGYGITAFFISRAFLREWRNAAVNLEKLETEKYKGQVRLLQDQLNPHFLFNSFNVLIDVIYDNQDEAASYVRELSKFYRHILEVQDEDLVSIDDELNFTGRYMALQKRRFGNALTFEENIKALPNEEIPPLVLQLLAENAIKHNVATSEKPLYIKVFRQGDFIVVENNLNRKNQVEEGTGIGLENIRKRYQILTSREVVIQPSGDTFRVKLPVLIAENV